MGTIVASMILFFTFSFIGFLCKATAKDMRKVKEGQVNGTAVNRNAKPGQTPKYVFRAGTVPKAEPVSGPEVPIVTMLEPHDPPAEGDSHIVMASEKPGDLRYMGSLHEVTQEGDDTCVTDLGHETAQVTLRETEPANAYAQPDEDSPLAFSPGKIVQGFVMSEILNRPVRRVRY